MGIYGQDWASYQSSAPSTDGLGFVFVKITEGLGYTNPRWVAQRDHAKANGLVFGAYHYPHMGNNVQAEADFFLSKVAWQPGDLIVLDWEGYDSANRGVSHADQLAYKDAWLRYVKGRMPHNPVGIYMNVDYWNNVDIGGYYADFLWIATAGRSAGNPGIGAPWLFHQYTDNPLDTDYCHLGSVDELRSWALSFASQTPTPAPTPVPTPIEEDPLPFSEQDIRRFIREEVSSPAVRDLIAYAVHYWEQKAISGDVPAGLPAWPWGDFLPKLTAALTQMSPGELTQLQTAVTTALQNATVHVQVDVTGPTTPATH